MILSAFKTFFYRATITTVDDVFCSDTMRKVINIFITIYTLFAGKLCFAYPLPPSPPQETIQQPLQEEQTQIPPTNSLPPTPPQETIQQPLQEEPTQIMPTNSPGICKSTLSYAEQFFL